MAKDNPMVHVWITKYALTQGVYEVNGEQCLDINENMISVVGRNGFGNICYHRPDWYTSQAEADAQVRKMIDAKIKSLKKSLAKMETLRKKYAQSE